MGQVFTQGFIMEEETVSEKKDNSVEMIEKEASEIAIIDERSIRDKIYIVRGIQVMLDFELAEIYGYTTSAFNQQVKNNLAKFDDDFRFQLTRLEIEELSTTLNNVNNELSKTEELRRD